MHFFCGALAAQNDEKASRVVSPTVITNFEQIWQMTEAETKEWHRIRMEYVVYYYDPLWKAMWGRCREADSYLSVGSKPFPIKPRQRILVEGFILPANGMMVDEPAVTILAENVPVEVLSTRGDVGNAQRFNKRLVTVEGYVDRQAARDANHHEIDLIVEGKNMLVQFLVHSGETMPNLLGSNIRIQGLYFARNEPTWPEPKLEIWVQDISSIEVLGQLGRDEHFQLPATAISQLSTAAPGKIVRIAGTVLAQKPGSTLTIGDQSGTVTLATAQTQAVEVNTPVEAIGYPIRQGDMWSLDQSLYRRQLGIITNPNDIASVPSDLKNEAHRIRFDYVVYFYDPEWKLLWGRFGDTDTYLKLGEYSLQLKPGQKIHLEGLVVPAKGGVIDDPKVTLLAENEPLSALSTRGKIGHTEEFTNHLVTVEGYVDRQYQNDSHHLEISLVTEGRLVTVRVLVKDVTTLPNLEGAFIEAKGVYSATLDPTGALPKLEVWVFNLQDIVTKGWLAKDGRFELPVTSIEKLAGISPDQLVRVQGVVRMQQPGRSLTIRDDSGQSTLLTAQAQPLQLGEYVEAIGYPTLQGTEYQLRESLYRRSALPSNVAANGRAASLRLAEELRELSHEEAARSHPVQLTGIVTWANPEADFFFVQDSSGGACVIRPPAKTDPISVGTKVTVVGTSAPGKFTPVVFAASVEAFAHLDEPEPKQVTLEQALTGIEESQWITLSGYVREVSHDGPWAHLELTTSAGEFGALLPWEERVAKYRGSVVRVSGVCSALTNTKRQLTGIQLWVPSTSNLQIEEAEPADPFTVAPRSIASLRQFSTLQASNRRVRVSGVVIHHLPGHTVHLQEGSESLLILSRDTAPLLPGDRVEVVGFPGRENNRVVLREAVYRRVSTGAEPRPLELDSLRPINVELDGQLVRIEAKLLELGAQGNGVRLLMQARDVVFEVLLEAPRNSVPGDWVPGSRLRLTGVYEVQFDEYKRPIEVHLLLRSAGDVSVLSRASWWTVGHSLSVTAVLVVCIILGFVWVVALRRRVQLQTGQISQQVESERAARLEAALARASKLESLGVLAGGIAHDFNNLLTVVMGNLSLARLDSRIQPETVECLREGERAAHRARDLTQQLITFAKGGEPVLAVTMLSDVVRDATRFALHGSKARCDYDLAPDAWPAEVDKGQIGQVVHNIIINATHAMPGGGVIRITLRNEEVAAGARASLPAGRHLRLAIADSGTGIRPEHLPRIFDPYYTTKEKGSGLGLASVYSIVKKHRGHIEVESKVGEGTTFHIWLPAQAAVPAAQTPEDKAPPPPRVARVLLMDDEASIRQLGGAIFQRLGLEYTAVADGTAVLREYEAARVEGRPYDLVMLDLTVPGGMGGAEAMEKLRRMDPQVRAVVSSGYSHDPVMANFRVHGFQGVIPKPYILAEFARTINSVLPQGLPKDGWRPQDAV
jgi:two-component system, cell cycle sensor histidine kinase and response regulator CckA